MAVVTLCEFDGSVIAVDKALALVSQAEAGSTPMFTCLSCHKQVVAQGLGVRGSAARFTHKVWNPACGMTSRLGWDDKLKRDLCGRGGAD